MSQTVTQETADAVEIPGIEILEEIGRGAHSVVYRGRIVDDDRLCAVKVETTPSDDEKAGSKVRYRREAAVLARFQHPALVHIVEVGQLGDGKRPYLVMEYVDGTTLSELIEEDGVVDSERIVDIGRSLASALARVHRRGLIHRDIKPGNILVRRDDGQVKLVDFGFVARARRDQGDEPVVGTLRYSAPEQSGMLQRPVDGRSDLYSLGAVLYECAVGHPPFESDEAGELMRQHAVEDPVAVRLQNPEVGAALSAIIDKLLAKDPDDRYAVAEALVHDLERLDHLEACAERGEALDLGSAASFGGRRHPTPLFGRQDELDQLVSGWLAARAGDGGVCWLSGVPGCGSSRLAGELISRATREEAIVLQVDCSQTPDTPFAALRRAGANFVRRIEAFDAQVAGACRAHIEEASREYMPVLARLTTDVFELPEAARRFVAEDTGSPTRYAESIVSFFSGLATPNWPVLIVLDEIPHIDEASRQVFEQLARRAADLHLYLVCTAHEDEEGGGRPGALLDRLEGLSLTHMRLGPLDQKAVAEMVAGELGGQGLPSKFVRHIAARTQGVPLAIREYLFAMIDAGLLRPVRDGWHVDESGLDSLDLPSDLTHLMLRRVDELDVDQRRILGAAAVEGRRFHLQRLYEYAGANEVEVSEAVSSALHLRLVEYGRGDEYVFVHQRVRQALIDEFDQEGLREVHRRIAGVLEQKQGVGRHLFAVAKHYALAAGDQADQRVYETNLRAGRLALGEHALEEAYHFLSTARDHAGELEQSEHVELEYLLGEASAANGRIEEAVKHLEEAIAGAEAGLPRARLHARLARVRMAALEMKHAWDQVALALGQLGATLPTGGWRGRLAVLLAPIQALWAERRMARADSEKGDESVRLRARLYELASIIAIFRFHRAGVRSLTARAMFEAARLPESPEQVGAQASYALALALAGRRAAAKRNATSAVESAERIEDRAALARAKWFEATTYELVGEARRAEVLLRQTTREYGHWLELWEKVTIFGQLAGLLLDRGYVDEVTDWGERIVQYVPQPDGQSSQIVHKERAYGLYLQASVCAWRGEGIRARSYIDRAHQFLDDQDDVDLVEASALGYELSVYYETGNLGEDVDRLLERWHSLALEPERLPHQVRRFYVYQAYVRLSQLSWRPDQERAQAEQRLVEAIAQLERAAVMPRHLTHLFIVCADREFLRGDDERGRALLERADEMADRADSPWGRYEVEVRRARRLAEQGHSVAAKRRAQWAHQLAHRHGWQHRARELRGEFDLFEAERATTSRASAPATRSASDRSARTNSLRSKRYLDSLLQVAIASGTVFDPYEQARVALDEIVRIFGAERAFLFSLDDRDRLEMLAGRDAKGRDLEDHGDYSMSVVERVRREREPVVSTGSREAEVLATNSAIHHDLRSIMAGPVQIQDRFLGVVYVDSRVARGVFAPDDAEILMALSSHLAIARETARAARLEVDVESERKKRELAEVIRVTTAAMNATFDQGEILARFLEGIEQVVEADRAVAFLLEDETLQLYVEVGNDGSTVGEASDWVFGDPRLEELLESRRPHLSSEFDEYDGPGVELGEDQSWMGVPIVARGELAGIVIVERDAPQAYGDDQVQLVQALAGQAGIAIENARLFAEVERLAVVDDLTGLPNRRRLFDLLDEAFARAKRYDEELSVIVLDVDHFKKVNDRYGHAVGDAVLCEVAARCADSLRDSDTIARYGGEEFVVVMPRTGLEEASEHVARRLRSAVADEPFEADSVCVEVTISLGVAQLEASDETVDDLLNRADGALYAAKAAGRNAVRSAPTHAE